MSTTPASSSSPTSGWVELSPTDAARSLHELRVVDVRQAHEFYGDLGHVPAAELVPLDQLDQSLWGWDHAQPILVVCRSGARSSSAAARLAAEGFTRVYNLTGGMMAWNAKGLGACARRHVGDRCARD